MSKHLRRAVTPAAALLLAVTATGCGGSGGSGDAAAKSGSSSSSSTKKPGAGTIYKQARQTALAAKNGHVSGTVTDSGTRTSIELVGAADGSNQKVTFEAPGQGRFTLLTVAARTGSRATRRSGRPTPTRPPPPSSPANG